MNCELDTLNNLGVNESAKIIYLGVACNMRRRLLDLGMIEGTTVTAVQESPQGDPMAYCIRGAIIALRKEDTKTIVIERIRKDLL